MALGYPGESVESMGWRERSPYGDIIFAEKFGVPAAADPGVDAELTSLGMMGEPSALTPQRLADINAAASKMGLLQELTKTVKLNYIQGKANCLSLKLNYVIRFSN